MEKKFVRSISVLVVMTAIGCLSQGSTSSQADAAFHKLQALAGDWQGKDDDGKAVKSSFVPIASGTGIMETLTMPEMDEMVTLYSKDRDSIVLMHYCPTNNQPRMRAVPSAEPIRSWCSRFRVPGICLTLLSVTNTSL